MGKINKALFSSKDQTQETPIDFFNKLDSIFKFGGSKDAAPFPSALIVFGDITREQEEALREFGAVVKNQKNFPKTLD